MKNHQVEVQTHARISDEIVTETVDKIPWTKPALKSLDINQTQSGFATVFDGGGFS